MPTEEETIVLQPGDYLIVEDEEEVTQTYLRPADEEGEITQVYFPKELKQLIESFEPL